MNASPPTLPPQAPQSQLARAAALMHDGRLTEADASLRTLLAVHPADPGVHHLLGVLCLRAGDPRSAAVHLDHACRLAPGNARLALELGRAYAAGGEFDGAARCFGKATTLDPGLSEAWLLLGVVHLRNARHSEALEPLRRAHALAPGNFDALRALADAQFHAGAPADALPLWQRVVDVRADDFDARLKLGESLSRLALHDEAVASYRAALPRFAGSADLWMALAQAEEDAGNKPAAQEAYDRAASIKPDWALPVSGLLGLQRGDATPELIARASAMQGDPRLPDPERAQLGYTLGKTLDALGDYPAAMASWHDANAARRRMIGAHDRGQLEDHVRRLAAVFDAAFFRRPDVHGSDDERPVFVVGMPRSGTTLTEQIIAAHPQAFGCGELPDIALILKSLHGRWPEIAPGLDSDALRAQAQRWLQSATRSAPAGTLRLVDKAPLNYYNLGLIALLFPRARVVWCRRDPRDIALSIYSENFSLDSQFATDLGDIGHAIGVQVRLMRHWQSVLPLPILELQYESLVDAPEAEARRLVDFIGLPWDPACLDFHRSSRGVQTPSRWQVREPIHKRAAGRWRHYADALATLDPGEP